MPFTDGEPVGRLSAYQEQGVLSKYTLFGKQSECCPVFIHQSTGIRLLLCFAHLVAESWFMVAPTERPIHEAMDRTGNSRRHRQCEQAYIQYGVAQQLQASGRFSVRCKPLLADQGKHGKRLHD